MATTKIFWTVLPNGRTADGRAKVSVAVSFQLLDATTLAQFDDIANWPVTVNRLLGKARLDFDGVTAQVTRDPASPPVVADLWTALFPGTTPVNGATRLAASDAAPALLRSFPASLVHGHLSDLYRETGVDAFGGRIGAGWAVRRVEPNGGGEQPDPDPDPRGWPMPLLANVRRTVTRAVSDIVTDPVSAYRAIDDQLGLGGGVHNAAPGPATVDRSASGYDKKKSAFTEIMRFYDRTPHTNPPQLTALSEPELDFHAAVALLGDYPELMRKLGLVIDLVVPAPAAAGHVRFDLDVPAGDPDHVYTGPQFWPRTTFDLDPFQATPRPGGDLTGRVLDLGTDKWLVTDLDVDGAAIKYTQLAKSVFEADPFDPETKDAALPALRSGGLTVTRKDRDAAVADAISRKDAHAANLADNAEGTALFADDLVRGYRIDVGTVTPGSGSVQWRSLCRRAGSYRIVRDGTTRPISGIGPDEGYLKSSAVTRDAANSNHYYVHEALAGWEGWSLVAPRPGQSLGADNQPRPPEVKLHKDFPLDARFTPVAGSLPALRYGQTYRLRARAVDLAGNSLGPDAPIPLAQASPATLYRRWEPVPPPVVVPRWAFNEGESLDRLVIRSTVDEDGRPVPMGLYLLERNSELADDHGRESGADKLDRRYRPTDERHVAPPKGAQQLAETHGMYDRFLGPGRNPATYRRMFTQARREAGSFLDTKVTDARDPDREIDLLRPFPRMKVANHSVAKPAPPTALPLPHRGAGLAEGEYVLHLDDDLIVPYLPDPLVAGVSLRGLPGGAEVETYDFGADAWPAARPFRIEIEEGDGKPRWFGSLGLLKVFLPAATTARVRMSCVLRGAGDLDALGPWSVVTADPRWRDLPEATRQRLRAEAVQGQNWLVTPWTEVTLVHAVEKPLAEPVLGAVTFARAPEAPHVTLNTDIGTHVSSTGHLDVTAAWTEWIDDVADDDGPRRVEGHARVDQIDVPERATSPVRVRFMRHTFGDTKHRNVRYSATATTRFREYFHHKVTGNPDLITRAGPATPPLPVPASRRPEPPEVAYVVPTFQWRSDGGDQQASRTRTAGGLRVYLKRPWFSSGDDEMIALVLPKAGVPERLVSRLGTDPVWNDRTAVPALTTAHFPNAARTDSGLPLAEVDDTVQVVAFTPSFDHARKLWYADVDVALAGYFPYLRLALARYQPFAAPDLRLSKVVLADHAQTLPARTSKLQVTAPRTLSVRLAGVFPVNKLGQEIGTSRQVVVSLHKRDLPHDGDLDFAPTGDRIELSFSDTAWTGVFVTPEDPEITARYRLLIEEHELYRTDESTAALTRTPPGGTPVPIGRRLVHADTYDLRLGLFGRIDIST